MSGRGDQTGLAIADRKLDALAREIRSANTLSRTHAIAFYRCAIKAGNAAIEAKKRIPHGQFTEWLEASCEVSVETARRWMRLADTGLEAEEVVARGGIRALLTAATDETPEEAKTVIVPVLPPTPEEQEKAVAAVESDWKPKKRTRRSDPDWVSPMEKRDRIIADRDAKIDALEENADAVMAAELVKARQTIAHLRTDVNVLRLRAEAAETRSEALERELQRCREGKPPTPSMTVLK